MADGAPLTFRSAGETDVGEIVALVESAYRGDASRVGWTTEADLLEGRRTDPASITTVIADPRSVLLLAEGLSDAACGPARELVACCHLRNDGGAAYFGMFAVRPGLQGAGIGRAVVAQAEARAVRDWSARSMWMTVIGQRSELIAWYERLGYERTGETRPFPYGDERFGLPRRDDLVFVVLRRGL